MGMGETQGIVWLWAGARDLSPLEHTGCQLSLAALILGTVSSGQLRFSFWMWPYHSCSTLVFARSTPPTHMYGWSHLLVPVCNYE